MFKAFHIDLHTSIEVYGDLIPGRNVSVYDESGDRIHGVRSVTGYLCEDGLLLDIDIRDKIAQTIPALGSRLTLSFDDGVSDEQICAVTGELNGLSRTTLKKDIRKVAA